MLPCGPKARCTSHWGRWVGLSYDGLVVSRVAPAARPGNRGPAFGTDIPRRRLPLELLAKTRLGDTARTVELRQRQLAIIIDGLSARGATELPGTPPSSEEQASRWTPGSDRPSLRAGVE
jgi:hypothetical protein